MSSQSTKGCYKRRRGSIYSSAAILVLSFAATTAPLAVNSFRQGPPLTRPERPWSRPKNLVPRFHPSSSPLRSDDDRTTKQPQQHLITQLFMSAANPLSATASAAASAVASAAGKASAGQAAGQAVAGKAAAAKAAAAKAAAAKAAAAKAASAKAVAAKSAASSSSPHIAVSIDKPLMTDGLFTPTRSTSTATGGIASASAIIAKALSALWSNPVFRVALVVFVTSLTLSMALRAASNNPDSTLGSYITRTMRKLKGNLQRVKERIGSKSGEQGIPMPFLESNEGWGVCTLAGRKRLGKSTLVQYDFDLPEPDYTLPLDLGQQIKLCCLDNEGNVARGDFFPFHPDVKTKTGSFSVLLPNRSADKNIFAMGLDAANFGRVIKSELKIGDEVALKPGKHRLAYRGQHLPVTDMVYVAFGTGIVPVLDQVRAVLPSGTSSVKRVTVIWINEATRDFDVTAGILEQEYFKYSQKLAVSCIVDDLHGKEFAENGEVNEAIPDFELGTMAVVAGPTELKDKAMSYLEERGYPLDTICVL